MAHGAYAVSLRYKLMATPQIWCHGDTITCSYSHKQLLLIHNSDIYAVESKALPVLLWLWKISWGHSTWRSLMSLQIIVVLVFCGKVLNCTAPLYRPCCQQTCFNELTVHYLLSTKRQREKVNNLLVKNVEHEAANKPDILLMSWWRPNQCKKRVTIWLTFIR